MCDFVLAILYMSIANLQERWLRFFWSLALFFILSFTISSPLVSVLAEVLCSVLMFVLDHSMPDNHLLLLLFEALENTHHSACSLG